jgi:hypothetical protein
MAPAFGSGENLYIVEVNGLNLHEAPGTNEPVQTIAPGGPNAGEPIRLGAGQGVWVIDRVEVDNQTWLHIVTEFGFLPGWIAAGPADDWVTQFDRTSCPTSANDAVANLFLRDTPMRALVCFGSGDQALIAYWPTASEALFDSPCPFGDAKSKWLVCYEFVNKGGDGTRSLAVYGTTDLPAFERGKWWTVIGHFDDSRSSACPEITGGEGSAEAAASVLFCRTRFVVDAVESPPVP